MNPLATRPSRRSFTKAAALTALCALSGCISAGRPFDTVAAQNITVGMTEVEVVAVLGAPQQVHVDDTGGRWLGWVYTRGSIFGQKVQQFLVRIADGKVDSINKQML